MSVWRTYFVFFLFHLSPIQILGEDPKIGTDLLHLKALGLQYGYPLDTFGGMFPTFTIESQEDECNLRLNERYVLSTVTWRCKYAIAIHHASYGIKQYIKATKHADFKYYIGDFTTNENLPKTWTNDIYKLNKIPMPFYLQNDLYPKREHRVISGIITSARLNEIKHILNECISRLTREIDPRKMRPLACEYSKFLSIMIGEVHFGGRERTLVPAVDSKAFSCKIIN